MEVHARRLLMGLFVLSMITLGFAFVYWLHNTAGVGERAFYRIRFEGVAAGLRPGSAVLFNGIRVGEVTELQLSGEDPRQVIATIAIERGTPMRADTAAAVEIQGLMGAPVVALKGGDPASPALAAVRGEAPMLVADRRASQDMMHAAREVLQHIDQILADNAEPLRSAMGNLNTFSGALARNSGRLDTIIDGLARMLEGPAKSTPAVYDLTAPRDFPGMPEPPAKQLAIPEPTVVLALDTQKILARSSVGESPAFPNAQWSDNVPKLFQAKALQSFENAKYMSVARASDVFAADQQLLLDIRRFQVSIAPDPIAEVEFSAKLMAEGRMLGARVFRATAPVKVLDAGSVTAALDAAFGQTMRDLVVWTMGVIPSN